MVGLTISIEKKEIKKTQNEIFVDYANPHEWWLSAHDLYDQTRQAYALRGNSGLTKTDAENRVLYHLDGTDRSCFLLGGFSLENMFKSLVVFENPNYVSDSQLSKELKSHDLVRLANMTCHPSLTREETELLRTFSKATVSWARYPCALNFEETKSVRQFTVSVFETYERLFTRLDKATKGLLKEGWVGPYGFYGKFTFYDQLS